MREMDTIRMEKQPMERRLLLLVIAYGAFVSLGLPDAVTGVAWPSLQQDFGLEPSFFGWILLGLCCGYFTSGMLAGRLQSELGIGGLLSASCCCVALAMAGNSLSQHATLFVVYGLLWGLGSGGIDSALNAYAANHLPTRHMSWLHACYSLGASLGPLVMSSAIVHLHSWRWGYASVSVAMLVMMTLFLTTQRLWKTPQEERPKELQQSDRVSIGQLFRLPIVWLQVLLFFVYTGLEALLGQWGYTLLTQSRSITEGWAAFWVSAYFLGIGLGRIVSGFIVVRVGLNRMIRCSTIGAVLGTGLLFIVPNPWVSCIAFPFIGLSLAAIFPSLMSRTPERLGAKVASYAIGYQIAAATLGVAVVPGLVGLILRPMGTESIAYVGFCAALALLSLHESVLWKFDRIGRL